MASGSGEVRNVLHGTAAGPTVQAARIDGGVHFHHRDETVLPVPRQLPAPPAHFVGREAELAEIDRLLAGTRAGPGLIVVTGAGGIGKSALALRWAQRVAPEFPDGQLYADLGAFDPAGPVAPGEVLGRALRSLGVSPHRVPAETAEQAAMFRSMTADKKLLLCWDSALSAGQLRPLLPTSARSVVLVTTRWRLSGLVGEGARFLTVEPLPEQAATELLSRAVGSDRVDRDPISTAALVRLCAGFPVALAVTAARLAIRPRWPISRLVTELTAEHRRLRVLGGWEEVSVQGAFDLSYQKLAGPVGQCYRLLGLHPGPEFGAEVVAAGLDTNREETARLLDTLLEANLLNEVADDRFRLHDLVRLHARQHALADPNHPALRRRILDWYLAGASAADRLLTPYRRRDRDNPFAGPDNDLVVLADPEEALGWLERERVNLVAAVQDAAPDLPLVAWQIADAIWALFHLRRYHQDRMRVDGVATECARRMGDRDREARMLRRWAFGHFDLARFDEARELFERCQRICAEIDDRYGTASAAEGLGMVALAQHRHPEAAACFERQLRLCRELGEHRRTGLALLNLASVENESGRHREALSHLDEAATVFAGLGGVDRYNDARLRIELGRALGQAGEPGGARETLTRALAEMRRLDAPRGQAQALHRLGELALSQREFAEARAHLNHALGIYRELDDTEVEQVRRLVDLLPPAQTDPYRMP
ncbi:tetratricopeptide repeat protein [Plantactinospora sp. CA-290183]|uniref:tetratricopeptide repeat protein n=1 Tax=Plantactinospora sp. CA-290183 TaxID=3240006 RepID=UPI003D8A9895